MPSPDAERPISGLTKPDRRLNPRYTVQVQIEIYQEASEIPMRLETTDLSRGGCYVQMMMPLEVGATVRMTLWLDHDPVVIRGRVVTRHPQFGNGIMFTDFEDQAKQFLNRYLDAIAYLGLPSD
jgi:hypothetical protein